VDRAAKEMLKKKLGNSIYAQEVYLKEMTNAFESKVSNTFLHDPTKQTNRGLIDKAFV
jgi:hypothetical protein